MINLQEAVKAAKTYLAQLDPDETYQDLRVEEVEINDKDDWDVTLGFYRKRDLTVLGGDLLPGISPIVRENRAYKTVQIDGRTGQATKIRIREVIA